MGLGGPQVAAIRGAANLHQALRAAADRANLPAKRRTPPAGLTLSAKWAGHRLSFAQPVSREKGSGTPFRLLFVPRGACGRRETMADRRIRSASARRPERPGMRPFGHTGQARKDTLTGPACPLRETN